MAPDEGRSGRVRRNMQTYRTRRRAEGLRLVQRWAIDTRSPEISAEIKAQSRRLRDSRSDREAMDWIEGALAADDPE